MYIKNQLNLEQIKFYFKRITILIRRDEVRKLTRKKDRITFINNYQLKTIQNHEEDSIEIDTIELRKKKTRKYFKYEKESHIRRFYRVKQKETILVIFDTSKNEKVLKTKKN